MDTAYSDDLDCNNINPDVLSLCSKILRIYMGGQLPEALMIEIRNWLFFDKRHRAEKELVMRQIFYEMLDKGHSKPCSSSHPTEKQSLIG